MQPTLANLHARFHMAYARNLDVRSTRFIRNWASEFKPKSGAGPSFVYVFILGHRHLLSPMRLRGLGLSKIY